MTGDVSGRVVLAFGERRITGRDFARMLGPAPQQRLRISESERRHAFLTQLETTELLATVAEKKGYLRDPALLASRKNAMVSKLLEDLFGEHGSELAPVTDDEVRARFEANLASYSLPERVRARHILVHDAAQAEKLLAQIAKAPTDPALFTKLAHERSLDVRTRERGGDLGLFAREVPPKPGPDAITSASLTPPVIPASVRSAAFALTYMGELAPKPIKSELGYHIVQLLQRQPASHAELPQVARVIGDQLHKERSEAAAEAFAKTLETAAHVKVDEAALSHVRVAP